MPYQSISNFTNLENTYAPYLAGKIGEGVEDLAEENILDSDTRVVSKNFEGPEAIEVQLIEGILDPKNHFAVTFKISSNSSDPESSRHTNIGRKDRKISSKIGLALGGTKTSIAL